MSGEGRTTIEKFLFDSEKSCDDLLADLIDRYINEQFIATKAFTCRDKEGTLWHCVAFDDEAEEIQPGYEKRFLDGLNVKIPHCGDMR